MRWAALAAATATALVATACGGDGGEDGQTSADGAGYYLSLGDSLTVGVQPDEEGVPQETPEGYTDALHQSLEDAGSELEHERMGCAGEDTTSFLEGGHDPCDEQYEGQSQIEAAEEFLEENADQVDLITLTIGGNNFTGCVEGIDLDAEGGPVLDTECVEDGLERIDSEMPEIADRLSSAAGEDTQIVAMTYYNPFLAALLLEDEEELADGVEEADLSAETPEPEAELEGDEADTQNAVEYAGEVLEQMNESIRTAYGEAGIAVADVEERFDSDDFEVPTGSDTGMPANVQAICDWTWMCNTEVGPDIHTNPAGAQEIADAFAEQVG